MSPLSLNYYLSSLRGLLSGVTERGAGASGASTSKCGRRGTNRLSLRIVLQISSTFLHFNSLIRGFSILRAQPEGGKITAAHIIMEDGVVDRIIVLETNDSTPCLNYCLGSLLVPQLPRKTERAGTEGGTSSSSAKSSPATQSALIAMKVAFGHAIGSVDSDNPHHFERNGSFCIKSKTLVQERPMVQD